MSSSARSYRLLSALLLALLLLLSVGGPLFAADFRGGEVITITKDQTIDDDLFIGANVIVVDGVVNGDLWAAGSQVTINGDVKGSLFVAGQLLVVNGTVDGTVYSGGSAFILGPNATVGRNLIFGGFSYQSLTGSTVGRDNVMGGYQAAINGKVTRNLMASLGALELNGFVGGNVDVMVDRPDNALDMRYFMGMNNPGMPAMMQPGLRVGPEANIVGNFNYSSPIEQSNTIAATPGGGITFTPVTPTQNTPAVVTPANRYVAWFMTQLRHLVTLLTLGALVLWLMPHRFAEVTERTRTQPVLAGAWGVLVVIIGYGGALFTVILLFALVAGVAALTLAGLATSTFALGFSTFSLAFTIFSMLVAYGSKLVVVYPMMHAALERTVPTWNHYRIVPLGLGLLLFVLLQSIPYLGWIISLLTTFVGMGAIWMVLRDGFTKPHATPPKLVLTPA